MRRFLARTAFALTLAFGALTGLASAPASAAPLATGLAAPATPASAGITHVQWGHSYGHGYGPRRHYGPPRDYQRRHWAPPRPVYGGWRRPSYCRTVYRRVYSPRWGYVSRPVRVCR